MEELKSNYKHKNSANHKGPIYFKCHTQCDSTKECERLCGLLKAHTDEDGVLDCCAVVKAIHVEYKTDSQEKRRLIKKEGHLEKMSRHLGIWRKRWTVLESTSAFTHYLSTYKEEHNYTMPTEHIRIDRNTAVAKHTEEMHEHRIMFYVE
eukprot:25088_1